jgi:hypothetical protein
MGSVLSYNDKSLWGEDLGKNYLTLIRNPGLLKWADNPADAELMRSIKIKPIPFMKVDLWGRTFKLLDEHSGIDRTIAFGYDWRAPLIDSAQKLAANLQDLLHCELAKSRSYRDPSLVFICHSMGGLVVRFLLESGLIDPSRIDRIIHIGTPLRGAPIAFRTAYETQGFPLFREIFGLLRRKNKAAFEQHLLECIRTFPSLYHLLPTEEIPYLYHSQSSRSNPLRETFMPDELLKIATDCHERLKRSAEMIKDNKIKTAYIYTEVHSSRETEKEYDVKPFAEQQGYIIRSVYASDVYGDGTVPAYSARGESSARESVINVDHMLMCNNKKVVDCLNTLL